MLPASSPDICFQETTRKKGRMILLPLLLLFCIAAGWITYIYQNIVPYQQREQTIAALATATETTLMDGSYQTNIDAFVKDNISFRNRFLQLRNQIRFSVFDKSSNPSILKGNDNVLFEVMYIQEMLQNKTPFAYDDTYLATYDQKWETVAQDLAYIQQKLAEKGKIMYVFLTPSKAHYMYAAIPEYLIMNKPSQNNVPYAFDVLVDKLNKYEINYYNSVTYFENTDLEVPVFQKSGTHYTWAAGASAFQKAIEQINSLTTDHKIKPYSLAFEKSKTPIAPDTDLLALLGLFSGSYDFYYGDQEYYKPVYRELETTVTVGPKIYLQGGSFEGPIIDLFTSIPISSRFRCVQNTIEMDETGIHPLNSVEEIHVLDSLDSDIFIFEINQCTTISPTPQYIAFTRKVIEQYGVPDP